MPSKSANVKNEKQYEALKDKGMSKERAAKIANSPGASSRGGTASGSGSKSKSIPRSAGMDLRYIRPCDRRSGVRATSTWKTCRSPAFVAIVRLSSCCAAAAPAQATATSHAIARLRNG